MIRVGDTLLIEEKFQSKLDLPGSIHQICDRAKLWGSQNAIRILELRRIGDIERLDAELKLIRAGNARSVSRLKKKLLNRERSEIDLAGPSPVLRPALP